MFSSLKKLTVGIALSFTASQALAVPMLYTFEGQVDQIVTDNPGIAADSGVEVGDYATFTFLIDFNADGSHERYNGTTYTYSDYHAGPHDIDFFFAELTDEADLLKDTEAFYNVDNNPTYNSDQDFGQTHTNLSGQVIRGTLEDGAPYAAEHIDLWSGSESPWELGAAWGFNNYGWYADSSDYSKLTGSLVLTHIQPVDITATPIPATLPLFLSGLALLGFGRKKLSKKA